MRRYRHLDGLAPLHSRNIRLWCHRHKCIQVIRWIICVCEDNHNLHHSRNILEESLSMVIVNLFRFRFNNLRHKLNSNNLRHHNPNSHSSHSNLKLFNRLMVVKFG